MPATNTPAKTDTTDKVLAALADQPGSSPATLALATGLGRSTVTKTLATLERDARATRTPGQRVGARRNPDTWTLTPTTPAPAPADTSDSRAARARKATTTAASPAPPSGGPVTSANGTPAAADGHTGPAGGRLRKGELNTLVLNYLTGHGQPVTASAVGKAIGRSSGAVANALARMETTGHVQRVSDTPRRYQPVTR